MKIFLAVVFSFVFAVSAFSQDLPNVDEFEVIGTTSDGSTAFLVSDVRRHLPRLEFLLLMAQAQTDDGGLHLNKDQWTLFSMKADCGEMSYQITAERGIKEGKPYVEKKGRKQKPESRSNIGQILIQLCNERPSLPVLDAGDTD